MNKQPKPKATANEEIRLLVDSFYEVQKTRIQIGNRIAMLKRDYEVSEEAGAELHEMVSGRLLDTEKEIEKRIRRRLKPMPIYQMWIGPHVKGVAEVLAGGLVAGIGDISLFATVSKLWKYCGVGLNEDGGIQKKKRGTKINYSPFLKTLCWKIGESFVKISDRGYYGQMIALYKSREVAKCEKAEIQIVPYEDFKEIAKQRAKEQGISTTGIQGDWIKKVDMSDYMSAGHVHNRAKRAAVKLFLSHLFQVWREIEGLPATKPYEVVRGEILEAIRAGKTPSEAGLKFGIHPDTIQRWLADPNYDTSTIHHHYEPPGWEKMDNKAAD